MNIHNRNSRGVFYAIAFVVIISAFTHIVNAEDERDDKTVYIKDVSSVMTNVDITVRNIGLNYLPMQEGVKRLNTYIAQLEIMQYPNDLSRQHKMVILSFKKIRMGFLLFSPEKKEISIKLIKSGSRLLKYVAGHIVEIVKKEGLFINKEGGPK